MSGTTVLLYTPNSFTGLVGNNPSGASYAVAPNQTISVASIDAPVLLSKGFTVAPAIQPTSGAYAEMTINDGSTPLVLTTQNTFYPVTAEWTNDIAPMGMSIDTATGVITSNVTGTVQTLLQFSYISAAGPDTLIVQLFKNGEPIPDHAANTWIDSTTYPNSVTVTGLDNISIGDTFTVKVSCTTDNAISITPTYANFSLSIIGGIGGAEGPPGPAGAGVTTITDGATTVSNAVKVAFISGASVSNGGSGEAEVTIDSPIVAHTFHWAATQQVDGRTVYTAIGVEVLVGITLRLDAANAGASAVSVYKAPTGTAFSGGTEVASTTFDLTQAANTVETLVLNASIPAITLAAEDSIGLVGGGTLTTSAGTVTVHSRVQS